MESSSCATCATNNGDEPNTLSTFVSTSSSSTTVSQGGYDYELLGGVDSRYECPICLLYMRDPAITSCGHRFCFGCILQWVQNKSNPKGCPVDGGNLNLEQIFPDNYTRREILACKAKCPYLREGCSVIMPLAEMDKHVEQEHALPLSVSCTSAKLNGEGGGRASKGTVDCTFKEFGCDHTSPSDQIARHMDSSVHYHLQLVNASHNRLKKILRGTELHHATPPELLRQDSRESTRWLLQEDVDDSEYNFRRQRSWDSVRSARRYNSGGGRPFLQERLAESDESISKHSGRTTCSEKEVTTSSSCQSLQTGSGGHSYQLKDLFERIVRLEQNDRERQIKIERLESRLSSAVDLCSKVTTLMDDLTSRYCNGTFVWKVKNFTQVCLDMRTNPTLVQWSPGFYTDTFGYKLAVRFGLWKSQKAPTGGSTAPVDVPLAMDESHTVGFYAHFLQGEYDGCIPWPFRGEMKFIIVHPTNPDASVVESIRSSKPDVASLQRPKLPRNPTGYGYPDVCSLKKIFSQGFVEEDTITFKILAKATCRPQSADDTINNSHKNIKAET